jgi:hypothetical protein
MSCQVYRRPRRYGMSAFGGQPLFDPSRRFAAVYFCLANRSVDHLVGNREDQLGCIAYVDCYSLKRLRTNLPSRKA